MGPKLSTSSSIWRIFQYGEGGEADNSQAQAIYLKQEPVNVPTWRDSALWRALMRWRDPALWRDLARECWKAYAIHVLKNILCLQKNWFPSVAHSAEWNLNLNNSALKPNSTNNCDYKSGSSSEQMHSSGLQWLIPETPKKCPLGQWHKVVITIALTVFFFAQSLP
jgi:hypothetical protein